MPEQVVIPRPVQNSVVPGHHGRLYPQKDTPLKDCPTNLDWTKREHKALAFAAGNPGDIEFSKDGSVLVVATHFLVFPEYREDPETGEVSEFARTVLFTKDGQTFRTTSAHAPHRIAAACDLFSAKEWASGIPFLIKQRMGKQGRIYHDIRLALEQKKE